MISDIPDFIRAQTRVLPVPNAPEIQLHLADDAVTLWQLTEEQLEEIGLAPPFWAFAWAGGQALARYVLDNPEIVCGKRVLDVASGSGLVAIAAMKAGAKSVIAADIDSFAREAAVLNAALNDVVLDARCGDALAMESDAEIILVGDLFYDRDIAARLLAWLEDKQSQGVQCLIGDPGRTYLPKDQLEQLASYEVPVSRALEDAEIKRAAVWRLE